MLARLTAILLCAWTQSAHGHHVMDYAVPATALEGFLSGLGHPVIGVDHLIFVIGAGVLAACVERGFLLPLLFVVASTLAVCVRVALPEGGFSEFWVAGSLLVLAAIMLVVGAPRRGLIAALFLIAGAIHGYALAAGIVGAERTPLAAYLAGLTLILVVIASAAWAATVALSRARPQLPLYRLAGATIGVAGLYFTVTAALG
jgi:urease accessory protein